MAGTAVNRTSNVPYVIENANETLNVTGNLTGNFTGNFTGLIIEITELPGEKTTYYTPGDKIVLGVALGLLLFLLVFLVVGLLEMYLQQRIESEYARMARDESRQRIVVHQHSHVTTVSDLLASIDHQPTSSHHQKPPTTQALISTALTSSSQGEKEDEGLTYPLRPVKKSQSKVTFLLPKDCTTS